MVTREQTGILFSASWDV